MAFIHRFGSSLNEHVHFHVCVVDGVFEEVVGGAGKQGARTTATRVMFHLASGIACEVVVQAQASLRKRILRAYMGRGPLESFEAKEMLAYKHSGFSVDTSVCIAAQDRAGLERLLQHCARPAFALERLRKAGSGLVYRCAKQHSEPGSGQPSQRGAKSGTKADDLHLTPLELIARLAALVPPPRAHRHRYSGVLAPNSPHRAAVTALAQALPAQPKRPVAAQAGPITVGEGAGVLEVAVPGMEAPPTPEPAAPPKRPAHYLWAVLIARIYEVFLLLCPNCGGQMRLIARPEAALSPARASAQARCCPWRWCGVVRSPRWARLRPVRCWPRLLPLSGQWHQQWLPGSTNLLTKRRV